MVERNRAPNCTLPRYPMLGTPVGCRRAELHPLPLQALPWCTVLKRLKHSAKSGSASRGGTSHSERVRKTPDVCISSKASVHLTRASHRYF